jgi:carboxyl-terminal processing protease
VEEEIAKTGGVSTSGSRSNDTDVRGCTEENMDLAVRVADLFVGAQPIVQISGREGPVEKINGDANVLFAGKVVVLTDQTTAGGAEIIAGAIQDSDRGKVFGVRTFGRGGIQKLLPAGENWVVLTTQKYLTPKGKAILGSGIEPAIPYREDAKSADPADETDRMLEKAIEYLRFPAEKAA